MPGLRADPAVRSVVLRVLLQQIFARQRRQAQELGVDDPQPAAVSFLHLFGSALNLHPRSHSPVPDAVFWRRSDRVEWYPTNPALEIFSDTSVANPVIDNDAYSYYSARLPRRTSELPSKGPNGRKRGSLLGERSRCADRSIRWSVKSRRISLMTLAYAFAIASGPSKTDCHWLGYRFVEDPLCQYE